MKWLELQVYTTDEGIDSVCAALNGVGITSLSIEESRESVSAFLRESAVFWDFADMDRIGTDTPCVKGYVADLPENVALLEAAKAAVERLRTLDLSVNLGFLHTVVVSIDDEDWANNWKKYYKPLSIGKRLLVLPSWEPAVVTDRVTLKLDPGMAFGTGAHHTTRMCLELLETEIRSGDRVLDLGCGSGILSIAALLLGASHATAVDIDPIVDGIVWENAALNGVSRDALSLHIGNLMSDSRLCRTIEGQYPVVLANIVADVILSITPFARSCVRPGGAYIVSGVIDDRLDEVTDMLKKQGFVIERTLSADDWNAILARG